MAEGTYEFECMRAELLGLDKPDKEQFELQAEKLRAEQEELAVLQAEKLETEDDSTIRTGGKLDELNSILSVTQKKLSQFKKTACGSLTNIFKGQSLDEDERNSLKGKETTTQDEANAKATDINDALSNLEKMENVQQQSDVQFAKNASLDIQKKMSSHLDKLDSLIDKAESAEISMASQNKQMKRFLK